MARMPPRPSPPASACRRATPPSISPAPLPKPVTPAANGQPANFGDTATQTRSVLDGLKATMDKMGVGFGDVVAAHVFLSETPISPP